MKALAALSLVLLVSAASPLQPGVNTQLTLVVATLDSTRADAFIGDLRFSGAQRVYAVGGASLAAAQRVARAMGIPVIADTNSAGDADTDAGRIAAHLRATTTGVTVVLVEREFALPFLRHVTSSPRASFPLSGTPGRMWLVTLGGDYKSAIRGSF